MSDLHDSADERRRDYIVGALKLQGAMYEGDARAYLAEHDDATANAALLKGADWLEGIGQDHAANMLRYSLDLDAEMEKASTSPVPTATPEDPSDPPYGVLDGEISITGYPPITLSGWHYLELAPDHYGNTYMQIGGWLPEGWPSEDTPAGTQCMEYAYLHGRAVPRDVNVQVQSKGYGGPRRFLKIQWRKDGA